MKKLLSRITRLTCQTSRTGPTGPTDLLRIALAALAALLFLPSAQAEGTHKPNILFIYTDDQAAWTLGAYGNDQARTPVLDRLAAEGARFTNAFVLTPVCSPARAELMTSRYGTELGILDFLAKPGHSKIPYDPEAGLSPELPTFPATLAATGYRTGLVGKWHLGQTNRFHPTEHGYQWFAGFREGGTVVKNPTLEVAGEQKEFSGLTTDVLTDRAIDFLREHDAAHADDPFLLSLHYRAPHGPWKPVAPEDSAPYEPESMRLPHPDYPDLDTKKLKRMMAEYLASVSGVDRNLGRLLDALDENGRADDTVVIFTSDHGYNMGHNGIHHKGNGIWGTRTLPPALPEIEPRMRPNLYDESMRVPLIVRWPGVTEAGGVIEEAVTNLDWFPTLAAIAGAPLPGGTLLRGRDFTPLLRGEKPEWNDDLYGEYSMTHYGIADMRCLRTSDWKLVVDFHNRDRDELYHLAEDPGETVNLIDDSRPDAVEAKQQLLARLLAAKRAVEEKKPLP